MHTLRHQNKKMLITSIFIAFLILLGSFLLSFQTADAIGAGSQGTPFGGMVYFSFPCTCQEDGSFLIVLGPPSTGLYLYSPDDITEYDYDMLPMMGIWLLGRYKQSQATCSIYVGEDCIDFTTKGPIKMAGTSY